MPSNDDGAGLNKGLTNYGDIDFSLFLRKAFIKGTGYSDDALSRPIVGIVNTGSGYNACHGNAPQLIEAVKRGVMLAGGIPVEFPTISVHESFAHPTSMYLRNLMSMDTEEMIRAQPMDAVALIGGCDKTVPAQLMGAISANVPAIQLVTGSMLTGSYRGERVGACTDCRRFWAAFRGDEINREEVEEVNNKLVASVGTCSVMGTASTMACMTEALGMMLPGGASAPAVTADRMRIAERTGAHALAMIRTRLTPEKILSAESFENALRVLLAIGGSTNGIVHLTAIAGRLGIGIDLAQLDRMSMETPVLLDLKPSGRHYMEDLHRAGGMVTVLRELRPLLHLDAMTVTGRTMGEEIDAAEPAFPQDVVRSLADPIYRQGGIAVLRGNIAPRGAIIKQSAASAQLMEHEGRAVVFEDMNDLASRIDDPGLLPQAVPEIGDAGRPRVRLRFLASCPNEAKRAESAYSLIAGWHSDLGSRDVFSDSTASPTCPGMVASNAYPGATKTIPAVRNSSISLAVNPSSSSTASDCAPSRCGGSRTPGALPS